METPLLQQIKFFLSRHFDLRQEKEDEEETIESLKKGVEFRGTNLWVLIFAIFLASLGLNTNSTAVIIGAMLISPLMGPIMGFGLGLGIADFDLVKRSLRNYLTATLFSVVTATIYFLISPISEAQSELLARTSPTIYDVLIAFFGGLAGIVAGSTKSKGNVIPGVAIATALMPPLCTAGFGLATGNLSYFLGAFYLYFINTVFISLSTYIVVRVLKYPNKEFLDKKRAMVVRRYMMIIVTCTIIPSLYLTYRVLRNTVFDEQVRSFVNKELDFPNTQVLSRTVAVDTAGRKALNVVLLGDEVPDMMIETARARMRDYGLGGIGLNIQQGFGSDVDINELKSVLMKDLYKNNEELVRAQAAQIDSLKHTVDRYRRASHLALSLTPELRVLYPQVERLACTPTIIANTVQDKPDTVLLVYVKVKNALTPDEQRKLSQWMAARTEEKNIKLIIDR
ncbi:membrane protein [Tannerella sp. oral taxon BU063 isolate Cell 6/7/9]|uniref:Membrane protein n=1 Tax=Tannerella sp. oral taxon BU063 isolate Cell 6/7/9 TaxID=1411021 RepID=W2CQ56_9BACT|nr:membrane protein [Tannerella sp. oral taxon BU063 isolate Cell 6/7/9]